MFCSLFSFFRVFRFFLKLRTKITYAIGYKIATIRHKTRIGIHATRGMGAHVEQGDQIMAIEEVQDEWLGTADDALSEFDLEHLPSDGASCIASTKVSPEHPRRVAQEQEGRATSPSKAHDGYLPRFAEALDRLAKSLHVPERNDTRAAFPQSSANFDLVCEDDSIHSYPFGIPPRPDEDVAAKIHQIAERAKCALHLPPPPPPPPPPPTFKTSLPLPSLSSLPLTRPRENTFASPIAPPKLPRILAPGEIGVPTRVPGVEHISTGEILQKTRNVNSGGPVGWFGFSSGTYTSVLLTGTTPPPSPPNPPNSQVNEH